MDKFISGKDPISELMQKSKLSIMNESFEEALMRKVEVENRVIRSINKNRKISLLFFIMGLFLGLIINFTLPKINLTFFGNADTKQILMYFQITFVVFILVYVDKLFQSGILKFSIKKFRFLF